MSILDCDSNVEVFLVQPAYGEEGLKKIIHHPGLEFPYNLCCLSAYLEKEGISSEIFDWRVYDRPDELLRRLLNRLKPIIVGITSVTFGINNAALIANTVKEINKNIITVIGGCHASALPEETLTIYPSFDYLIHGEGEVPFTNFVKAMRSSRENIEELRGVAFRKGGEIKVNPREEYIANLDNLPFPVRNKIDIYKYAPNPGTRNYFRLPSTGFSVGRGCPYNCQFCYKGVWGNTIRMRSVSNVISEIKECIRKYGIHDFRFYDDVLTFPKWDIKDFCRKVLDEDIDISWNCWSRVNDVNYEKLFLMKEAGCYHIKFGIEFGTEKALKLSKKGVTLKQSREAIKIAREVGIECKGSFIFGIPGETIEDCRKTLDFALEVSPDFATFYAYDSVPGSKFYQLAKEGLITEPVLPPEITEKLVYDAYRKFYLRPTFIFQRIRNLFVNPRREIKSLFDGLIMMVDHFIKKTLLK